MTPPVRATANDSATIAQPVAFERLLRSVQRRLWLQQLYNALSIVGTVALALLAGALLRLRLYGRADVFALALVAGAAAATLVAAIVQSRQRVARTRAATCLDRAQPSPDLCRSAAEFATRASKERSTFMTATLAQAEFFATTTRAAAVAPFGHPRWLWAWPPLCAAALCVLLVPTAHRANQTHVTPVPAASSTSASGREVLARVPETGLALEPLTEQLERLREAFERSAIEPLPLLRALQALEARVRAGLEPSAPQRLSLIELGHALGSRSETAALGRALAAEDLAGARAALLSSARMLREARSSQALEALRHAVRAALARHARWQQAAARQRRLDSLERERSRTDDSDGRSRASAPDDRASADGRSTDPTRNEFERALERLANERQDTTNTATALQDVADALENQQRKEAQRRDAARLLDRIAALRQALSQRSDAEAGARTAVQEPSQRSLEPGRIALLQTRAGTAEPTREGGPTEGPATRPQRTQQDSAVRGSEGPGPSRSTTIYDAAAYGFATRAYRTVHADYAAHAERELEQEPLPQGYRLYVRRYFDLIGPPRP